LPEGQPDNPFVVRKLLAVGLSVAVHAAALGGPLVHAHLGGHDSDHHHEGATVHAHFSGHGRSHADSNGLTLADDTDRAVPVQFFLAVNSTPFHLSPALLPTLDLIAPAATAPRSGLQVVHGHDPPFATSGPSRAPPTFLS
jgi:hypothetical protein